jgi:hypothetical protein
MSSRLTINTPCQCGSRQGHELNFKEAAYYLVCEERRHRTKVCESFALITADFFCNCGGMYIPTGLEVNANGDVPDEIIPILRELKCPACRRKLLLLSDVSTSPLLFKSLEQCSMMFDGAQDLIEPTIRLAYEIDPNLEHIVESKPGFQTQLKNLFGNLSGSLLKTPPPKMLSPDDPKLHSFFNLVQKVKAAVL